LSKLRRAFPSNSRKKFARHLKQFKPDVVLCTHFLPFETLGLLKTSAGGVPRRPNLIEKMGARGTRPSENWKHPFVVSIVTDFEAHALWMDACVDLYCVAAEETKARLVARDAATGNVVATGIPIAAKFLSKPDARAVRNNYGLRDDQPVLLVLGGGFGMGPVAEILAELDKMPGQFQTLVVTGRNEELRRKLATQTRRHPTHVLGFSTNMHELMAVADLIITKPGGLTTSEALALGKPLFILNPIPGQEAANSDFLLERGAAVKVNRVEDLPFRVEKLLGSKKLVEMAKAAKSLGRPQAATAVCQEVLKRLSPH
jgi:processive 1,2-diacylglycerol beta-glucosyltransferase